MGQILRYSATSRLAFALLMACALAVRLLVPAGYMPGTSSHGITVELCSGIAGQKVFIDLGKSPTKAPSGHEKSKDCTFSAGLGLGLSPPIEDGAVLVALLTLAPPLGAAIADLTPHRLAAPPPPAQAPPSPR